jgi:O-antigen ligase
MFAKKNLFLSLVQISFYFIPISLVLGSLIVNINAAIFILLGLVYLKINKIKVKFNLLNTTLLLFFLTIIISTYFNLKTVGLENLIKSLLLLKFFFIYIIIETLFLYKKIKFNIFCNICFCLIIFISLDVALQFFSGKNIIGLEPHDGRIAGIFGHEAIAGGFIQRIFIFSLIGFFMISVSNIKYKNYFFVFFYLIVLFGVFLASNRVPFIMLGATFFIILLFFKMFRKNLLISLILFIPIFFYFYKMDPQLNVKFNDFKSKVEKSKNDAESLLSDDNAIIKSTSSNHVKIYLTTIKSFNENKFIGNGLKSFRFRCVDFLDQKNTKCSTHPHNYHLEILHDVGILGYLLISIFVLLLIFSKYKDIRFSKMFYTDKIIVSLLLLNLLIEIFPIKSTGSLFSTWTGTILWVSIALVNYGNYKKSNI